MTQYFFADQSLEMQVWAGRRVRQVILLLQ